VTLDERSDERDLTYSRWHRPEAIRRFLPYEDAEALTCIDVDAVEACGDCSRPLALFELARDVGQAWKATTIVAELARLANVPAYLVLYRVAGDDIARFRTRQVAPRRSRELELAPAEYAAWLQSLRERHTCAAAVPTPACHHRPKPGRRGHQRPVFEAPAAVTTRVSAAALTE
jgi:hypothetical protein